MYSRIRVKIVEGIKKGQVLINDRLADDHWLKSRSKANRFILLFMFLSATAMAVSIKYYFRIHYEPNVLMGLAPNLFSAIAIVNLSFLLEPKKKFLSNLNWSVFALLFYEFLQLFDEGATFDWFDVLATFVGSYFAAIFVWKLSQIAEN